MVPNFKEHVKSDTFFARKHIKHMITLEMPLKGRHLMDGPYLRLSAHTTYHSAAAEILFRLRHKASAIPEECNNVISKRLMKILKRMQHLKA